MRFGGRVSAAIEILDEIIDRNRPASEVLKDWGRSHRFAGSRDRSAIGNIVYDALRHRASIAWRMGEESGRALALGALAYYWGEDPQSLGASFLEDEHSPGPLGDAEIAAIGRSLEQDAPGWVLGDFPEWLTDSLEGNFAEEFVVEAQALAERPPTDFRVNSIKAAREKVLKSLARFALTQTRLSPVGLRIAPSQGEGRTPNIQPEAAYQKGWVEVQDEGSQVVSQLVFARPGEKVLDYCAGAGGKSLALSAVMENKGQVFAYDADRTRLAPIYDRLKRAGTRNVQVRGAGESLDDLEGKMDRVLVDAPCTGSGTWRRRPDAKWRLTPEAFEKRQEEQALVLREGSRFVRPGGFLCYVTCSIFAEENEGRVYDFLDSDEEFELLSAGEVWEELYGDVPLKPWSSDGCTVTLTPASTKTDGFFFAVLGRKSPS